MPQHLLFVENHHVEGIGEATRRHQQREQLKAADGVLWSGKESPASKYPHLLGTLGSCNGFHAMPSCHVLLQAAAREPVIAESSAETDDGSVIMHSWTTAAQQGTIKKLAFGGTTTYVLYTDGRLLRSSPTTPLTPVLFNEPGRDGREVRCVDVACGRDHVLVATYDGTLYTWGANDHGQLGHGNLSPSSDPKKVPINDLVVAVAAGTSHSVLLTTKGNVMTFGRGTEGQLGHGNRDICPFPHLIKKLFGTAVLTISAASHYTLMLCKNGGIVACGENWTGVLGQGTKKSSLEPVAVGLHQSEAEAARKPVPSYGTVESYMIPRRLKKICDSTLVESDRAEQLSAGAGHGAVKLAGGTVLTCGLNNKRQLGRELAAATDVLTYEPVELPSSAAKVAAGSGHTAAFTEDGRLYFWGILDSSDCSYASPDPCEIDVRQSLTRTLARERKAASPVDPGPVKIVDVYCSPRGLYLVVESLASKSA